MLELYCAYAIYDCLSLGLGEGQRVFYAALCGVTVLALALSRRPRPTTGDRVTYLWASVVVAGMAMVLSQEKVYPGYVAGDAMSLALPVLLVALAGRRPPLFFSRRSLRWLYVCLFGGSCLAFVLPWFIDTGTSRYREPAILLMALTWTAVARPRGVAAFATACCASSAVLVLTVLSGARFALVLWLGMGVALVGLDLASRVVKRVVLASAAVVSLLVVLNVGGVDDFSSLSELRVGNLLSQLQNGDAWVSLFEDGSMKNRILEADDALHTRRTKQESLHWVFGTGHGATFDTGYAHYGERELADGTAHHIHFGLVLLAYRYGVLGVVLYFALVVASFRTLLAVRRLPTDHPAARPALVYGLASLAYLANLLLFNQLVDPIASYSLAGCLAIGQRLRARDPIENSQPAFAPALRRGARINRRSLSGRGAGRVPNGKVAITRCS